MKKFIFFLIIVILLIFILSEFIGDKIIKGTIETNISKSLNRETKIRNLKINYLKGEAILEDIILKNNLIKGISHLPPFAYLEPITNSCSSNKFMNVGISFGS